MNPYTMLADAAREFVDDAFRPCEYQYGEFESSDGHLAITLRYRCTTSLFEHSYTPPQGVQVNYTGDGFTGIVYFYEKPTP